MKDKKDQNNRKSASKPGMSPEWNWALTVPFCCPYILISRYDMRLTTLFRTVFIAYMNHEPLHIFPDCKLTPLCITEFYVSFLTCSCFIVLIHCSLIFVCGVGNWTAKLVLAWIIYFLLLVLFSGRKEYFVSLLFFLVPCRLRLKEKLDTTKEFQTNKFA